MVKKTRRRGPRIQMHTAAPLPDLPRIFPRFNMLEEEDCCRLHKASCEILKITGVIVYNSKALELLKNAGAQVEDNLVRFPATLIDWALDSVPSRFNLYYRGSEKVALKLDGKEVYFGPGSDTLWYLDPRTKERRDRPRGQPPSIFFSS